MPPTTTTATITYANSPPAGTMFTAMNERAQFIWAACTIILWMITFLFLTGYATTATALQFPFRVRDPPNSAGAAEWSAAFAPGAPQPIPSQAALMTAAGCNLTLNGGAAWAPLCDCLANVYNASRSCQAATSAQQAGYCFMSARPVQRIRIRSDSIVRPYTVLLMINSWASFAAAVLLVRGKLSDKGSYSVQLLLQTIILVITLGSMWLALSSNTTEWVTMLLVSLLMVILGWIGDDDPDAWFAYQFLLLYATVLPGLMVIFNAYTHRMDAFYFACTTALALVIALGAAVSYTLQRIAITEPNNQFWAPTRWTNMVLVVLSTSMIAWTYDEGLTAPELKASWYAWFTLIVYISLAMYPVARVGSTFFVELLVRAMLTVAMIDELFGN